MPPGNYHHGDLRSALIAAGLKLTRAGGPEALRLREATRLAGVTPNAAYRHFANHNALLAAVAAEIQDMMATRMRRRTSTDTPHDQGPQALARLRGVGLGYVQFAIDEPGWFQLAFFAPNNIQRPDGLVPPPLQLLRDALDDLVTARTLSADRRATAEWSCWAGVHGLAELIVQGPLRNREHNDLLVLGEQVVDDIIAGAVREEPGALDEAEN